MDPPYQRLPVEVALPCERDHDVHISAFGGPLLLFLDKLLLVAFCGSYALLTLFLLYMRAPIWSATLIFLGMCAPFDFRSLKQSRMNISMLEKVNRRFIYGVPLALLCFYSASITHRSPHCIYYIVVEDGHAQPIRAGVFGAGLATVLSMALGAVRMDCHGSAEVSAMVRKSRGYLACLLLYRASEISLRLGSLVLVSESLRARAWVTKLGEGMGARPGVVSEAELPILFVIMLLCLVGIYLQVLQCANREGNRPNDDLLYCLVMGLVMLAMNPLHFFARPGFEDAARSATKYLFIIRVLELVVGVYFVWDTATMTMPQGICDGTVQGLQIILWGCLLMYQVLFSLIVHGITLVLVPWINRGIVQALVGNEARDCVFTRPGEGDFRVPPPPANAGLGRAWVQLGGGLQGRLPLEIFPEELVQYRILRKVDEGQFGIVLEVATEGETRAMKLMNMSQERRMLALREVSIVNAIWREERELAMGFRRRGHPNIVTLDFWSQSDEGRRFFYAQEAGAAGGSPVCTTGGVERFHMAMMMEYCDGNLESFIRDFPAQVDGGYPWEYFCKALHLLAQMVLALVFLHDTVSIAHRDLKPTNVLLVRRGGGIHCKLADFGYSRVIAQESARELTRAGTAFWSAPEIAYCGPGGYRASQTEEKKLDIYSLGLLAFALFWGPQFGCPRCVRTDHHRCNANACVGCRWLDGLRRRLGRLDQDTDRPAGPVVCFVVDCVTYVPMNRPSAAQLLEHRLFGRRDVVTDFDRLRRLDI
mmetsp:Transcript_80354/g.239355  ORF Transcript_80354/g.239355 Transcript_80354/m.239355 type:complete len:763 (+) Transcript_80354:43-2331(+)